MQSLSGVTHVGTWGANGFVSLAISRESYAKRNQVWHIRLARGDGRRVYFRKCGPGSERYRPAEYNGIKFPTRDGAPALQSLGQQLPRLFAKVGSLYPLRENFRLTPKVKEKFTEKLRVDPDRCFGQRVTEVVRKDGLKLGLDDGSWVSHRLSGTEPVVRVYSDSPTRQKLEKLSGAAKQWVFE